MSSSCRNTIARFLLGIFASISLAGHGLHLLPHAGHDHAHVHHRVERSCDHNHDAAHAEHEHQVVSSDSPSTPSMSSAHDDCLICEFLTKAQLETSYDIDVPATDACELQNDRDVTHPFAVWTRTQTARGPPRV